MRIYILKFMFGGVKHSCRVLAHSFDSAAEAAERMVEDVIGGCVLSVTECPLQG